jgi:hypothetical protein
LEQASPPDVIFKNHNLNGFGIDLPATQARFLSKGLWNGNSNTWTSAYNAYWSTGPGQGFDRHWLRDNLRFCLDAPQEAFATLANQYFTSSEVMLQLALARWAGGITNCINQFLFFADVYALGSNSTWFYRINTAANVTRNFVPLQRDAAGHVCGLSSGTNHYDFVLDAEGNVSAIFVNALATAAPRFVVARTNAGQVFLTLTHPANYSFVVERSTNLVQWAPLITNVPSANSFQLQVQSTLSPQSFYRIRRDW